MVARGVLVRNIMDSLADHRPRKVSSVVAEYLLRSGRTSELQSILRDLSLARAERQNIVEVTAVSATSLSTQHKSAIKQYVRGLYPGDRQVIVNEKLDESLIGGIKLEFPDKQLEMSVEARITKLRKLIS